MKALILWAEPTSTNLGVRVLHEGTRALLRRAFPDVQTQAQGYGPGDSPFRIASNKSHAKRLAGMGDGLVDWVRDFDLVVDTRAGDSFTDIYGLTRLTSMTLMAEVVRRAGVPLVLGPQTIGPFTTRRGELMARRTLRTSRAVMVRDTQSYQAASTRGRRPDLLTTDVVFALARPPRQELRDVLVNPSGLLWHANPHVDHLAYRRLLRETCRRLLADGRKLSFLAHVLDSPLRDNDGPVVRELAAEFVGSEALLPTDLGEARVMLASGRVAIGSRMHACLNALSTGTPAVALAYSDKFKPLLDDIGWTNTFDLRGAIDPTAVVEAVTDARMEARLRTVLADVDEGFAQATEVLQRAL